MADTVALTAMVVMAVTPIATEEPLRQVGIQSRDQLASLLAATAGGNHEAFAKLHRLTRVRLLRIAHRITGDRAVAEEVLQEVFLSIWQKAHLYSEASGAPIAWMTFLVRNRAIDRLRVIERRRGLAPGADSDMDRFQSRIAGKTETQILVEQSVLRCLQNLQEKYRAFILLAFYEEMTHRELSRATNTPLGTVKSNLRRGLAKLKLCLEQ